MACRVSGWRPVLLLRSPSFSLEAHRSTADVFGSTRHGREHDQFGSASELLLSACQPRWPGPRCAACTGAAGVLLLGSLLGSLLGLLVGFVLWFVGDITVLVLRKRRYLREFMRRDGQEGVEPMSPRSHRMFLVPLGPELLLQT
jgi:hypothetical protein